MNSPQNITESLLGVKFALAPGTNVLLYFAFGPREEVDRGGSTLVEYWRAGTLTIE
jgi:hypothetical protein